MTRGSRWSWSGLAALALAILAPWAPAQAITLPQGGVLAFAMDMDGTEIGRHVVRFKEHANRIEVDIDISFTVKFLDIPVYRYNHVNRELWDANGALIALDSRTDDDGKTAKARLRREGDSLSIEGTANRLCVPGGWLPSSYWNAALIHQTRLIDSRNGGIFAISVTPGPEEQVPVGDKLVMARRYDLSGDLTLSVWYDRRGEWVKLAFDYEGRHFDYRRIEPETRIAGQ